MKTIKREIAAQPGEVTSDNIEEWLVKKMVEYYPEHTIDPAKCKVVYANQMAMVKVNNTYVCLFFGRNQDTDDQSLLICEVGDFMHDMETCVEALIEKGDTEYLAKQGFHINQHDDEDLPPEGGSLH